MPNLPPNQGDARAPSPLSDDPWKRLKDRGIVLPEVSTLEEYQQRFVNSYPGAVKYLEGLSFDALVSLDTTLEVHRMLFGDLYKEAGVLRSKAVTAGVSMPADPSRIKTEWELLRMQLPEVLGDVATLDSVIASAAFFHVRAKCIQPVNDGNKRTTRLQASVWQARVFGSLPQWSFDTPSHRDYYDALRTAQTTHDIAPMVNILRQNWGLPLLDQPHYSPFRIRPYLIGERPEITAQTGAADLLDRSRVEGGKKKTLV